MKYTLEVEIKKPIESVIALFDNPENLKKWMKGLEHFEWISGTPGQPGAKSKLTFHVNGRKMEMIETITVRNLPNEFSGTYEMNGVYNIIKNKFVSNGNYTRYITEQEFQFSGFMKLMGWMMPRTFKKQSLQLLEAFKHFAEQN